MTKRPFPVEVRETTVRGLLRAFGLNPDRELQGLNQQTVEGPEGQRLRRRPVALEERIVATQWSDGIIRLTDDRGGTLSERLTGEHRPTIGLRTWERLT